MDIVREAEAIAAEAAKPRGPHPRARDYFPHLRVNRIELRAACLKAEEFGDEDLHHRFLLLLSEVDKLESDLEGR